MSVLVVSQGLNRSGDTVSQTAGYSSSRFIQTMSVDDATGAFAAGNTKLNDAAGYTAEFDAAFDSTPTRSGQVVTHIMTVPAGSFNAVPIRRVALHDNATGSVDGTTATLWGGVDGLSLTKTASFSVALTLTVSYS